MRSMQIRIQVALATGALFSLVLLIVTGVCAQAPGACADEIEMFCSDIQPGGGAVKQCLEGHANELSAWCKSSITGATAEAKQACHDDIVLLCGDPEAEWSVVVTCLKGKESWLSFECKVKMGLLPANLPN